MRKIDLVIFKYLISYALILVNQFHDNILLLFSLMILFLFDFNRNKIVFLVVFLVLFTGSLSFVDHTFPLVLQLHRNGLDILTVIFVFHLFEAYVDDMRRFNFVIAVAGDSGSGKTTLSALLKENVGNNKSVLIETDGLHKWERGNENWNNFTHLNPKGNYLHRLVVIVERLKLHRTAVSKDYLHDSGLFSDNHVIEPKEFVIICGLHTWCLPKLRELADLKIFIDTPEILRVRWKVMRDVKSRGYTNEKVLEQIKIRESDYRLFVKPQIEFADIIISTIPQKELYGYSEVEEDNYSTSFLISTKYDIEDLVEHYVTILNWHYTDNTRFYSVEVQGSIMKKGSEAHSLFNEIISKIIYDKDVINNRFG